jgi:hypothetical protein
VAQLQALRARAQDIFGLDLEDAEATDLYNEADSELCTQAGWTRANVTVGPTVADQVAYALPAEVFEVLTVYVNGLPYDLAGEDDVAEIGFGTYRLRVRGVWWISYAASGVESISLYPTPSEALSLTVNAVVYPDPMVADTDTPACPTGWDRALHEYVQAVSIGGSEDDMDRKQLHMDEFDRQVARLRQHRIRRSSGTRGAVMRIRGVTA